MSEQKGMIELQTDFARLIDDCKVVANQMTGIARNEEWSVRAFRDFEEIEQHLKRAEEVFIDTPDEPDDVIEEGDEGDDE